jgi:hypothetical protein
MPQRITYNSLVPTGAGAGYKVERVAAPPVRGNCFAAMQSASELDMMMASAPEDHRLITEKIKRMGKVRDDSSGPGAEVIVTKRKVKAQVFDFGFGAMVKDTKERRKGIIIRANAGYTAKSHKPVHQVQDVKGNSWYAKESDLKLIY